MALDLGGKKKGSSYRSSIFWFSGRTQNLLDRCIIDLKECGMQVDNKKNFFHKVKGVWRLNCDGRDLGFLGNDNNDMLYKEFVSSVIKDMSNEDIIAIIFYQRFNDFGAYYDLIAFDDNRNLQKLYEEVGLSK